MQHRCILCEKQAFSQGISSSPLAISIPKIWYRVPQNPWFPTITICIQKVITFGKIIVSKYLIWQVTRTLFIQTPSSFCKTNIQPKPPCKHVINNDQWINCTQFHRVKKYQRTWNHILSKPQMTSVFFFGVSPWENGIFHHLLCVWLPV